MIQHISTTAPAREGTPANGPKEDKSFKVGKMIGAIALVGLAGLGAYFAFSSASSNSGSLPLSKNICTWNEAPKWTEIPWKYLGCQSPNAFAHSLSSDEEVLLRTLKWCEEDHAFEGPCGIQEYFRLALQDKSKKLLYLFSRSPIPGSVLVGLLEEYDVKAKEIGSLEEICHEIDQAAKSRLSSLQSVILHMNNSPDFMQLRSGDLISTNDSFQCFSKIDPKGRIVLIGPSYRGFFSAGGTNGDKKNLAQTIADQSGRTVVASSDRIACDYFEWGIRNQGYYMRKAREKTDVCSRNSRLHQPSSHANVLRSAQEIASTTTQPGDPKNAAHRNPSLFPKASDWFKDKRCDPIPRHPLPKSFRTHSRERGTMWPLMPNHPGGRYLDYRDNPTDEIWAQRNHQFNNENAFRIFTPTVS